MDPIPIIQISFPSLASRGRRSFSHGSSLSTMTALNVRVSDRRWRMGRGSEGRSGRLGHARGGRTDGSANAIPYSRSSVSQSECPPARLPPIVEGRWDAFACSRAGQGRPTTTTMIVNREGRERHEGRSVSPTLFLPSCLTDSPSLMLYVV